ncbi:probable pectinesterase 29 [Rhododendron vialii]|uniref:probable pectinesterase 29 n=1 Tax=Rhododendron vialii TaxID=182163 RepID=UPI00265F3D53|nr:probable pectinesterase 29 [Rhododendron vialii]
MLLRGWFICGFFFFFIGLGFASRRQLHRRFYNAGVPPNYPTIYVDQSGQGNFTTIQSAIDSIPSNNGNWICVYIKAGEYREQVSIPIDKPYIYLKGEGKRKTNVVWEGHDSITTSPTFISQADNIVAKSISFRNSYNNPPTGSNPISPAVAAMISGDKSAFYRCGFFGLQDTLWDVQGRHYFKLCSIQGAVDFVFGAGQSIYERCTISVIAEALDGLAGFITAQGRSDPKDTNGFVFKGCNVIGTGRTYLGRPWREYARVVFYNSSLSDIVTPEGWDAWGNVLGREYMLTFAEHECHGMGSNTSNRVKWEARLDRKTLTWLTSIGYIDDEGWISRQPFNMLTTT